MSARATGFTHDLAAFIPFRDLDACERVRRIRKQEIARHPNPEFKIRIIEDSTDFAWEFALDIVRRIRQARDAGGHLVMILPVGPMPQYALAARLINEFRLSCSHVTTFNMDEYADQDGNSAPLEWPGSFQRAMMEGFFLKIDRDLRPPREQIHF